MVEFGKVNVKLSDVLLKKLKTAVKKKTGRTLRMSLKMLGETDLPLIGNKAKIEAKKCIQ